MLGEIAHEVHQYMKDFPNAILVREQALLTSTKGTIETIGILHKVVGVTDLYAWSILHKEFQEVSPISVKCFIGGERGATKQQVADGLIPFVGNIKYTVDDESDAVGVGITWLIKNGYLERKTSPAVMTTEDEALAMGKENKKTSATKQKRV